MTGSARLRQRRALHCRFAMGVRFARGKDLRALPLIERKAMLAELLAPLSSGIRYVEFLKGDGPIVFEHACALGRLEGIVSKLRNSRYRSGKSDAWRKAKCEHRREFIVAGFIPNSSSKRAVGALGRTTRVAASRAILKCAFNRSRLRSGSQDRIHLMRCQSTPCRDQVSRHVGQLLP